MIYRDTQQSNLGQELLDKLRFRIIEDEFECGYCKTHVVKFQYLLFDHSESLKWSRCSNPNCGKLNIFLENKLVHPSALTVNVPKEVPDKYAARYKKASQILNICPESSATCSRKCLEMILEDHFGAKSRNLNDKINEVKNKIPSRLFEGLHQLREVGNFGAHPKKNTHTAELIEVELGEAEYCLWLLEDLFDECYIKPAKEIARSTLIDEKIKLTKVSS
jgi:hypothetical protein